MILLQDQAMLLKRSVLGTRPCPGLRSPTSQVEMLVPINVCPLTLWEQIMMSSGFMVSYSSDDDSNVNHHYLCRKEDSLLEPDVTL